MPSKPEIDAEVAFGEGLGASVLLGALLKALVHKGLFSDSEVVLLIDQTLLGMEKLQGTKGAPPRAVGRARARLEGLLKPFQPPHHKS